MRYYGMERVMEPKGAMPATAWKVDNGLPIREGEFLVELTCLHVEWDSFQQICNYCGFDEKKIKRKIMDIIEKRGKMHNPFTSTGGTLLGKVIEIAPGFKGMAQLKVGDQICSLTSLCGVPIKIDTIDYIDYQYGQIKCTGHAIMFETSPVYKWSFEEGQSYALSAMNEAGCLLSAFKMAQDKGNMSVSIIGRSPATLALYSLAVKKANPSAFTTVLIHSSTEKSHATSSDYQTMFGSAVDRVRLINVGNPHETYLKLKEDSNYPSDLVIIVEDIEGADALSVLMTKEKGCIYFTTVKNHYAIAQTVAETMGKDLNILSFDQYVDGYADFTTKIVRGGQTMLERIHQHLITLNYNMIRKHSNPMAISLDDPDKSDDFIYQSPVTAHMVDEVLNVAKYDCNVIIQGETGVGKEKVLSLIHQNSKRRSCPCIKINCATIHENLAESEFFGYEPGSFTGATAQGKIGYFEMANNGILFLDEIGSLPMSMQSKLLRVLQENTFYRVGGTKQISVNVRVIVANNIPLKRLVDEGLFREDLYYRLNICNIDVPPLRERTEDIECLAKNFVLGWAKKYGIERDLSDDAINMLTKYHWPGNVRELENIVHRLVIGCKEETITGELVGDILHDSGASEGFITTKRDFDSVTFLDFHKIMDQQEKALIEYALKKGGTTRKAAEILGLPQTTFARKKIKYML